MSNRLQNKVAIITGASKGIGEGIATVFAKEGAIVVISSRTESDLKQVADRINLNGGTASYIIADVTNPIDMDHVAQSTLSQYGKIDILIHNAGIYPLVNIEDMSVDEWHHVINTNLSSTFYAVKSCLPAMKQQNNGRIIFTSSISGPRVGLPGASHYTASKAGMNGFMKTIAIELAQYNITVNAVEPGNIISAGFEELGDEHKKYMTAGIPMGRLGTAEEIAYAHLFLASDESRFMTGQSMIIDGGQILPESDLLIPR